MHSPKQVPSFSVPCCRFDIYRDRLHEIQTNDCIIISFLSDIYIFGFLVFCYRWDLGCYISRPCVQDLRMNAPSKPVETY